jgi:hypothetical protein
MKTISIISQKGGAGKTTLALNLAGAAETFGHRSVTERTPSLLHDYMASCYLGKFEEIRRSERIRPHGSLAFASPMW